MDANFLIAAHNPSDPYHLEGIDFLKIDQSIRIIPQAILPEVAYMLNEHVSSSALFSFWDSLIEPNIQLESISISDLKRAKDICLKYDTSHFDFADCCITALSERLEIIQITFDYRHFRQFRPAHCHRAVNKL